MISSLKSKWGKKMETVINLGKTELAKVIGLIDGDKNALLYYYKKLLEIKDMISLEARTILGAIEEISRELIVRIDIVSGFVIASDNEEIQKLMIDDISNEVQKKDKDNMFS